MINKELTELEQGSVLSFRVHAHSKNQAARIEMDSENRRRCQTALYEADAWATHTCVARSQGYSGMKQKSLNQCQEGIEDLQGYEILRHMHTQHSQELLIVNARRRNGLILYKRYHAEFAGPGAAVGGMFDRDVERWLPVGNLDLLHPGSAEERQRAYLIRRQWIRLTKQITDHPVPLQRAQNILTQFRQYFDADTIAKVPDEAFALLVGVLPQTIRRVRELEARD